MPTPRQHGGAALLPMPIERPGIMGLTSKDPGGDDAHLWASLLTNTVLDDRNHIASRKGYKSWSTTKIPNSASPIEDLISYTAPDGTKVMIASQLIPGYSTGASYDGGYTWNWIAGGLHTSADTTSLVYFRDRLLVFSLDFNPYSYAYPEAIAPIVGAEAIRSNTVLGAFGRVWAKVDKGLIRYSALLDETDWTGSDTGIIDMTAVWSSEDEITGLAEFNGSLVIFGKNNIVVYADGTGSKLGIDPAQMYVVDTIAGVGCIAQDSITAVKGDIWFLDHTGFHSFGRLLGQKSNPLTNLSSNVQALLQDAIAEGGIERVRSEYSPMDRMVLLSFPEAGKVFIFDTVSPLEDGTMRCTGVWDMVLTALLVDDAARLYLATDRASEHGRVGMYSGYVDSYEDVDEAYSCAYQSDWLDLGTASTKILKRLRLTMLSEGAKIVTVGWRLAFEDTLHTVSHNFSASTEPSVGTYNLTGAAEQLQLRISWVSNADKQAIHRLVLYAKVGRMR